MFYQGSPGQEAAISITQKVTQLVENDKLWETSVYQPQKLLLWINLVVFKVSWSKLQDNGAADWTEASVQEPKETEICAREKN